MKTLTIELTEQEAQIVTQALDGAIRAGGFQASELVRPIIFKLHAAANPAASQSEVSYQRE